jgi:hypothetical protein
MHVANISHYSSTPVGDTQWHSCLRHCATSRKFVGSIPDGAIGIFHWHNPPGHTTAWGTKAIVPWNFTWEVKAAGAYSWQPYHLHVPTVLQSGSLNLLEPSGPVMGLLYSSIPVKHVLWLQQWPYQYFAVLPAVVCQKILKYSPVALQTVQSGEFFIAFPVCMCSASLVLSLFRALGLQWDVPADAWVLCDKALLLFVVMSCALHTSWVLPCTPEFDMGDPRKHLHKPVLSAKEHIMYCNMYLTVLIFIHCFCILLNVMFTCSYSWFTEVSTVALLGLCYLLNFLWCTYIDNWKYFLWSKNATEECKAETI